MSREILLALFLMIPTEPLTLPEYVTLHQAGYKDMSDFGRYAATYTPTDSPTVGWRWEPFPSRKNPKWYYEALPEKRTTIFVEVPDVDTGSR